MKDMNPEIRKKDGVSFIYLPAQGSLIEKEADGLDLISLCFEHGLSRILIQGERLSDDFLRLRTGVAGAVLQKFSQYNVKAAVTLEANRIQGKFEDFLVETNRGSAFRTYDNYQDAEAWLIKE